MQISTMQSTRSKDRALATDIFCNVTDPRASGPGPGQVFIGFGAVFLAHGGWGVPGKEFGHA